MTMSAERAARASSRRPRPVQVHGEVLSVSRAGAYHALTVVAPEIADTARPGQFVTFAVGGSESNMLLRRAFSVYKVADRGVFGGTVEVVFAVTGPGTAWLSRLRRHDPVDVVGPLGRPFAVPRDPANALLVGGGYGSAPLFSLAALLRSRGCQVDFALGAATADKLFGAIEAKRVGTHVALTTADGSRGERGWVTDVLPALMRRAGTEVVYACGPMGMLEAVTRIADQHGVPTQVAVEESMACGIGVCMTCVLPVVGDDGVTRMVRSCVDGPVFRGERVRFADVGTVPPDALGAPAPREQTDEPAVVDVTDDGPASGDGPAAGGPSRAGTAADGPGHGQVADGGSGGAGAGPQPAGAPGTVDAATAAPGAGTPETGTPGTGTPEVRTPGTGTPEAADSDTGTSGTGAPTGTSTPAAPPQGGGGPGLPDGRTPPGSSPTSWVVAR